MSARVGPITFSHEQPRSYLEEYGEVVTFRVQERTTGETWWRKSRLGEKWGNCTVEEIESVCPHGTGMALQPYLSESGFKSVSEWQAAIRRLNGKMPAEGWLYRVTLK